MQKTRVFSMTLSLVIAIAHSAMAQTPAPNTLIRFAMQRSVAASGAGCIPHAAATVTVSRSAKSRS